MRKYLILTMALGALLALTVTGFATAEKPVKVRAGNLELTFNGGFSPKALPKSKPAPISLSASGVIKTVDGTHPPALKEFLLEGDKNASVQVKGFPECKSGQLQSRDTASAKSVCKSAIIGTGKTEVQISFPEQTPIPVKSDLLVFNGGEKGGKITFFIHAYITVPTPAAIVTTVTVQKKKNGRFGTYSVAKIPKIAGGSGSVKSFSLTINKKYTYKGKQVSVLSAKCPDGKLQAHGTAIFADGTKASAEIIRTCTGKG